MIRLMGRIAVVGAVALAAGSVAAGPAVGARAVGRSAVTRDVPCGDRLGSPGALIKAADSSRVYLVDGTGMRRWIATGDDFFRLFDSWSSVVTWSETGCVKEGLPLLDTGLMKYRDRPEIYIVDNGQWRWIPNPATFNQYHFSWTKVQIVISGVHWIGPDWT